MSLKTKLTLMTIGVAVSAILIIGSLGYRQGRGALRDSVWNQLTGLRAARKRQIESYFLNISDHMRTLSEDRMIVEASRRFAEGAKELEDVELSSDESEALDRFYNSIFIPELESTAMIGGDVDLLRPSSNQGQVLQHRYVVSNPNLAGNKQILNGISDGSKYDETHILYHPILRNLIERFHYYDLFLIEPESGNVVYTVAKETDFGTNLLTGPYRGSDLAKAFVQIRDTGQRGEGVLTDINFFAPSLMAPAQFYAAPVFDESEMVAVLAVQIPIIEINRIMTGSRSWESDGLGKSGETYLIGDDYLMRSGSRFMIESPQDFLKDQKERGASDDELQRLQTMGSTILTQHVRSPMAESTMLHGKSGTEVGPDYRGVRVLSSYAPIEVDGLRWGILAEMDEAEAFAPANEFQKMLWSAAAAIILGVTMLAMFFSWLILRPIERLADGADLIGKGDSEVMINVRSKDELGRLATTFNEMVERLQEQDAEHLEQVDSLEGFIEKILPLQLYRRHQDASGTFVESYPRATVVHMRISGLDPLFAEDTKQGVGEFDELVGTLDEAVLRHGLEASGMNHGVYQATCGAPTPRVDHVHRCLEFAIEAEKLVQAFGQKQGWDPHIQIGVDSGEVAIGVVGRNRVSYDFFGPAANGSRRMVDQANGRSGIFVSQAVRDTLEDDLQIECVSGEGDEQVWHVSREATA